MTSEDILGFLDEFFESIINRLKNIPTWARLSFCEQWAKNIPPFLALGGGFLLGNQALVPETTSQQVQFLENISFSNTCNSKQASQDPSPPSASTHLFGGEESDLEIKGTSRLKKN